MACCEALLGRKVQGIKRNPGTAAERADNIEAVLYELTANILQTDLSHISGSRVVAGDPVDVHSLLEILAALLTGDADCQSTGMPARDRPKAAHTVSVIMRFHPDYNLTVQHG